MSPRPAEASSLSYIPIDSICTASEPAPDWLIPETIHRGSQILLAALAGVGKSVFCYTLSNALATGSEFMGMAMPTSKVLYFDEENSVPDLSAYVRWTWRGLGCPSLDLLRVNLRVESLTLGCSNNWANTLRTYSAAFQPNLIIIDTATPAFHIEDENDNSEAAFAAKQLKLAQLAGAPGCSSIVLKHLRKDHKTGKMDVRGAKAWKGAVDAIWYHFQGSGARRANGWRKTYIRSEKTRAYGLRDILHIDPTFEPREGVPFCQLSITRRKADFASGNEINEFE